jgi:CrcB protein
MAFLIIALGSAIGGAARHGVNVGAARLLGTGWPFGTLIVNVVGSFVIGAVVGYFATHGAGRQRLLLFLTTGLLGGFTTFSAFSLDAVLLWQRGREAQAVLYALASVGASIAALLLALALMRRLA